MKKLLCFFAILFTGNAFAADGSVLFTGSVTSDCSFNSASSGSLNVVGTSFSSTADGTINVVNNDAGVYTLSLGTTTLTGAPDGQAISSVTAAAVVTGANTGITLPATLTNSGTDSIAVSLSSGLLDATATAGNYVVTQVVQCL